MSASRKAESQTVQRTAKPLKPLTPPQKEAADPSRSVWVAASAGSGKTHVLSTRILRLLLAGADPQSILCLTYTKAAATEMASRLFAMLSAWITLDEAALERDLNVIGVDGSNAKLRQRARQLFATALETPGGLKIQTIHAFCEHLLQLFPVEAGIAPGFRVMEDEERQRLTRNALSRAMLSAEPQVAAAWEVLAQHGLRSFDQLEQMAQAYLSKGTEALAALEAAGKEALAQAIANGLGLVDPRGEAELEAEISAIDEDSYRRWACALKASAEYKAKDDAADDLLEIVRSRGASRRSAILKFHLTKGEARVNAIRKKLAQDAGIISEVANETARVAQASVTLDLKKTANASIAAVFAMAEVRRIVESEKRAQGLYDFEDLISRTATLLGNSENAQWVLYKLDKGLDHILVDEAQDTSPAQWQIIRALAEEFFGGEGQRADEKRDGKERKGLRRSVFSVGDRKQSIFSFQGANLASFDDTRDWLKEKALAAGGLATVDLTVSYRSLANVLATVDMTFASGTRAREGFGDNKDEERPHEATRKEHPGVVEFWQPVTRLEGEEPDYWKAPVDQAGEDHPRRRLARLIAQTVQSWIGKRLLHGAGRAVAAGDILILVQRRNLLFSALIAALRQLGIPVAGADRLELSKHIIVQDLLALAQVMTLPGDDHALACLLKSPLVPEPLDDDRLVGLAAGRGAMPLRGRLDGDAGQAANSQALSQYGSWAGTLGPFAFYSRVIQRHRTAILRRLGDEADDAVRAFLDLALAFEQDEGPSLSGFAAWMKGTDSTIKREMEEAQGQVRIMTVHGSKGLEAPIVMLADATDVRGGGSGSKLILPPAHDALAGIPIFLPDTEGTPAVITRWKDHYKQLQFEENMRLFYVGMTRARDELYVCGSYNSKLPGKDSWWMLMEQTIKDASSMGFTSRVLLDGTRADRLGPEDVMVEATQGRQTEAFAAPAWLDAAVAAPEPVARPQLSKSGDAMHLAAARRGIAIHALLEKLPDWPAGERHAKAIARAARHGLEQDLAERLLAIVEDPGTAMFFAPGSAAEVELCGRLANGEVVLGRIDRLARDGDTFLLLDYKSGQRPVGALAQDHDYVRQLAGYADLLREAHPGVAVRAALLWTQSGDLDWIPDDLLHLEVIRQAMPAS